MSCTRPVITRISQHATRPLPSAVGTSRWDTMPFSVPAIIARACCCWCGGEKAVVRVFGSGAAPGCGGERTRWALSAAPEALDRIREVDLVLGLELRHLLGVVEHLRQRLARVFGEQPLRARDRLEV